VIADATSRAAAVDRVATDLLPRANRLTRLLLRSGPGRLSRTESALLAGLDDGPKRITELADAQVLAQPTVTQLVDRLQRRGLVARERWAADGRVVLVSLTEAGRAEIDAVREHYRGVLRTLTAELPDDDVAALVAATETLGDLIDALQEDSR
jgi:DNA-binding MarR family transcriptional regulator